MLSLPARALALNALLVSLAFPAISRPSGAASSGPPTPVPPTASPRPVQRVEPGKPGPRETLESEHFLVVYDPRRLTGEQAEAARQVAEAGWKRCVRLFGKAPEGNKLRLDLTPEFVGATGFARPGDLGAEEEKKRPMIGVRWAELEYLGLSGEYVLTHEIGHVFSGKLAGSSLGEGIADWAAGSFAGLPARAWWGAAFRQAGLWIDPDALFVTGEFVARPEVDEVIRTAQYAESGLLVKFLVDRFGWEKSAAFMEEYGKARGRLNSNEDRKNLRLPRRFRPQEGQRDPRLAPDASEVRGLFERHFGLTWERLRAEWEAWMTAERPAPGEAERLILAERIYGAIRNWEMWALERQPEPDRLAQERVRQAFTRANRALQAGDLRAAAEALAQARLLVDQLRRPRSIA